MTDFIGVAAIIAALGTAVAGVIAQLKVVRHVDSVGVKADMAVAAATEGREGLSQQLTAQGSQLSDIHASTNGSLTAATEGLAQARKEIAELRVYIEKLLAERNGPHKGGL